MEYMLTSTAEERGQAVKAISEVTMTCCGSVRPMTSLSRASRGGQAVDRAYARAREVEREVASGLSGVCRVRAG